MRCINPIVWITLAKTSFKTTFKQMLKSNAHNFIHMEKHNNAYNSSSSSGCTMLQTGWIINLPAQKSLQMWFLFSSYDSHSSKLCRIFRCNMFHVTLILCCCPFSTQFLLNAWNYSSYTFYFNFKHSKCSEVLNIIIIFSFKNFWLCKSFLYTLRHSRNWNSEIIQKFKWLWTPNAVWNCMGMCVIHLNKKFPLPQITVLYITGILTPQTPKILLMKPLI